MAILFGAAVVASAVLSAEAVCRAFESKQTSAGTSIAMADRWTGWRLRPLYDGPGPDLPSIHNLTYRVRINRDGFRGGDATRTKPPNVVRIAAVGDSVTFGFAVEESDAYSALVATALSSEFVPARVEWINGGVPGYTSLQGLRSLDRVLAFHPDVVTILYGWNDGWLTMEPYAARTSVARTVIESSALLTALTSWRRAEPPPSTIPTFRYVPPSAFEANLLKISAEVRRAGAVPVLLTAPAAFGPDTPPDRYFNGGWAGPRALLEPKHQLYADAVRRVAADHSIILVDCARRVPADPRLFLADGYHPNRAGQRAIAETIVATLRTEGLQANLRR